MPRPERREGIRFEGDIAPGETARFHYVPMTPGAVHGIIAWPNCAEEFDIIELRIDGEHIAFPFTEPVPFRLHQKIEFSVRNHTRIARRFFGSMTIARASGLTPSELIGAVIDELEEENRQLRSEAARAKRIEEKAAIVVAVWDRLVELGHNPEVSAADIDALRHTLKRKATD